MRQLITTLSNYGCFVVTIVVFILIVIMTHFPYSFPRKSGPMIASNSLKCLGVKDYETIYTTHEKMDRFHNSINMSCLGDKKYVFIELCSEEKRVNMASSADSKGKFFYMLLPSVYDLWVLILFTMFESEVFRTINIAPFRYWPADGRSSGCLRSCVNT